jgi:cardiolipin synthase A/B
MRKLKKFSQPIIKIFSRYYWWQTAIFLIGILALLSVVGALFIATGSSPKRLFTNGPVPAVTDPQFSFALAHSVNSNPVQGGKVEVYNNGDEFFPALLSSLDSAQKTINFSVYIWEDGEVSSQILDKLIQKQRSGVQVRVLLDGMGGKHAPDELFEELQKAGGKVEKYRTASFGKLTRYHRRNHRRSIVIDGHIGFTGGMAVKDVWLGTAQDPEHWRDMMFKVNGAMARGLQDAFVDEWASSSGEILIGEDIFPSNFAEDENSGTTFIALASSPADDSQPIPKFVLLPMLTAKQKLYITTPYFIANTDLLEVLKDKAKAGVDVRLILPGSNIDNKISRWGAQNYYGDLLESGVKIYEYQPTFIHSKFFTVDDQLSVIGSHNLNSRSRQLDEENALAIFDSGLATKLNSIFVQDQNNSKEITSKEWNRRNPLVRLMQLVSRILAKQS